MAAKATPVARASMAVATARGSMALGEKSALWLFSSPRMPSSAMLPPMMASRMQAIQGAAEVMRPARVLPRK